MQTELYKNMVYEWTNVETPNSVERLLSVDPSSPHVWTISVYNSKAQPLRRTRTELEASLNTGEARVLTKDPYAYLIRPERNIKQKHREHRDKAWDLIASLLSVHALDSTLPQIRSSMRPKKKPVKHAST